MTTTLMRIRSKATWLSVFGLAYLSVTSAGAQVDSVVLELPSGDPCAVLAQNIPIDRIPTPAAFKKITGKFKGKVNLDVRKYAQVACQEVKNEMIASAEAQIKAINPRLAIEKAAKAKLNNEANKVYDGFLFWVAETAREPLLANLSAAEREKFAPGSASADSLALEWLARPETEIQAYVSAYLHSLGTHDVTGLGLGHVFDDYMSGASQEIIGGFGSLLENAQSRLGTFLGAKEEIIEHKADYVDTLRGAGFSGKWINNIEASELKLRQIDADYNAVEGLKIVYDAIQTDEPDEKIRGFFQIISHMGSLAEDSQIPLASLVGQIVAAYGDAALQMLEGLDTLETAMRAREGYCLGLGTHSGRDKREALLADAIGQGGAQADIRICPIRAGISPWKDIYFQEQPQDVLTSLFFFVDDKKTPKFIKGTPGHGGKDSVLAAIHLIDTAQKNGFQAFQDKSGDIATIAAVYNTPFTDDMGVGGILALQEAANTAISNITAQRDRLTSRVSAGKNACAPSYLAREISERSGLDIANFPDTTDIEKIQTLKTNYMIGFVEKHRKFAAGTPRRTGAYETYEPIANALEKLSLLRIDAKVHETGQRGVGCTKCAGAGLKISVKNGTQIRGCEALRIGKDGTFAVHVLTQTPRLMVNVDANIPGAETEVYPIDFSYLNYNAKINQLPYIQSIDIDFPVKFETEDTNSGDPQTVRAALNTATSACLDLEIKAGEAADLAQSWRKSLADAKAAAPVKTALSGPQAKSQMQALLTKAKAAIRNAEQSGALACSAAKDSEASFISSEEERMALRVKAKQHLSDLRGQSAALQSLMSSSVDILRSKPSAGAGAAAGLVDQTYANRAREFLINIPVLTDTLNETAEAFSGLRGPFSRWKARNPKKAKSLNFDFGTSLSGLNTCQAGAISKAGAAAEALNALGADSAKPTALSPLWSDAEAMSTEILQAGESLKGLITQAEDCVGADPIAAQGPSGHSFVAQGWTGTIRLQSVYVAVPGELTFECDSNPSCRSEVSRWLATENSKTPEDAEFNQAISSVIQQYISLLFSGLQAGLIIEPASGDSFSISSGDVGFGDMTAQTVTVKRTDDNLYMGTQTIDIKDIGPAKVGADMIVEGRDAINVKTYINVANPKGKFEISFTSDLVPGIVNADAIKEANMAAIMSLMQ